MPASSATARQSAVIRVPSWHRRSTRAAILEAAREMILAEGMEATSLVRIAEKTGFAPNTVYAYFVKKTDLAVAIVAEDLANFAKTFGEDFPFTIREEEEPLASPTYPSPTAWHEGPSGSMVNLARWDDLRTEETGRGASGASIEDVVSQAIAGLEARLADVEARLAADPLEKRISGIEQSLDDLEVRTSDSISVGQVIEKRLGELSTRLGAMEAQIAKNAEASAQSLTEKLDAFEMVQRQTLFELRTLLVDASGRIEVLEHKPQNPSEEKPSEIEVAPKPLPTIEPAPISGSSASTFATGETDAAPKDLRYASIGSGEAKKDPATASEELAKAPDESYIAVVRRAAQAAHSLAVSEEKGTGRGHALPNSDFLKNPTRMLLATCLVLAAVVAGVGVVLKGHAPQEPRIVSQSAQAAVFPTHIASAISKAARAQTTEGLANLNGEGIPKNEKQAARFLSAAAQSGEPVAQYWLATMYEHGTVGAANPKLAYQLYEAAAEQGNLRAMYKLAVADAEGWGTAQNYEDSARWFLRAAQLGLVNAQYNLGVLYERGLGVPQNLMDAYKWYALAAMQGDKDSSERVDVLASQLGPDDLAAARAAAAEFKAQPRDANANWTPASDQPAQPETATP